VGELKSPEKANEVILKRYEEMRQQCVNYGGLGYSCKSSCHQAIRPTRHLPTITYQLAELCDDMALALNAPSPLAGYRERIKAWVAEQLDYWESHKDHTAAIIVLKDLLIAVNSGELEK
jgi:hypothetical protein